MLDVKDNWSGYRPLVLYVDSFDGPVFSQLKLLFHGLHISRHFSLDQVLVAAQIGTNLEQLLK